MLGDAGLGDAGEMLHAAHVVASRVQQPMQQLQPQRMRQRLEQRRPLRIVDLLFHECSRLSKHNAFVCPVFFLFISIS